MIYNLIEGKNDYSASEYLIHSALWQESTEEVVRIIPCEGNHSLYKELRNILSVSKEEDRVYIAYDFINMSTTRGVSLVSDLIELISKSSTPCYFFKFDCFELALLATGVPQYLAEYESQHAAKEKLRIAYSRLLDILAEVNENHYETFDLVALRDTYTEFHEILSGSPEQIIKRLCNLACRAGCSGFRYSEGKLGHCWYEDCDILTYCTLSNCKRLQASTKSFCSPVCNTIKAKKLLNLWGAQTAFDLYLHVAQEPLIGVQITQCF